MMAQTDLSVLDLKTVLSFDLQRLLKRKGLNPNLFEAINATIVINSPISDHAAWIYRHIYRVPFLNGKARFCHGIAHVSRAAIYAVIFGNLYRRHGHQQALRLTNDGLKLIQIALLFHDAAREGEEEDLWDHESATFLYFYLTRLLKITSQKAKKIAEAVANKDWRAGEPYLVLSEIENEVFWSLEKGNVFSRTIYHQLIHDSDCLDCIRARYLFDGKKLNFYEEIACHSAQKAALNDMAELIIRARSLIEIQGDSRRCPKPELKKRYNKKEAYLFILQDIFNGHYLIFQGLYANGQLLTSEQLEQLTLIDETNILNQQRILARAVITPTALSKKPLKNNGSQTFQAEDLACREFRKTARRKGVPTQTSKANGLEKEGNPNRSTSLMGGSVFADVGCLLFNPDEKKIKGVYDVDADTGWGKNRIIKPSTCTLDELETNMKTGGSLRFFKKANIRANHNEILYDIMEFDAIYYTYDPTFSNEVLHDSAQNTQLYSGILKAIHLQLAYSKFFNGKLLPIYEYSGIHHYLKKSPSFTEEKITCMWVIMCKNFMTSLVETNSIKELKAYSVDDIMIYSMYKSVRKTRQYDHVATGCRLYSQELRLAIEKEISEARETIIAKYVKKLEQHMHSCVEKLVTATDISYELCKSLIIAFKIAAENELLEYTFSLFQFEVQQFIQRKLNSAELSRENLFFLIYITRKIGLMEKFKPTISLLKDCRWIVHSDNNRDFDKPFYSSDIYRILRNRGFSRLCPIDLAYLNVLEISNGIKSRFIFLNDIANSLNSRDILRELFADVSKEQSDSYAQVVRF